MQDQPSRLTELESVIERTKHSHAEFIELGQALEEVRDSKLYKERYGTFEDYCELRWGFKRAHGYRLVEASKAALALPEPERPKTEGAIRKSLKISKILSPVETKSKADPNKFTAKIEADDDAGFRASQLKAAEDLIGHDRAAWGMEIKFKSIDGYDATSDKLKYAGMEPADRKEVAPYLDGVSTLKEAIAIASKGKEHIKPAEALLAGVGSNGHRLYKLDGWNRVYCVTTEAEALALEKIARDQHPIKVSKHTVRNI
jgi:hypothetical protein